MKLRVPYLKWREGRPRWEPGPALRQRGFAGRDLKCQESGAWLPLNDAIKAAEKLNLEVSAWRTAGGKSVRPPRPIKPSRTFDHLYDLWIKSPEFRMLASSTQSDYKNKADVFLEVFGEAPVVAAGTASLKGFWEELYDKRGHAMANGVLAVASIMLTYAAGKEWIKYNPAMNFHRPMLKPRTMLWLPKEVSAIDWAATELERPSIADAYIVALHSGQRQGDVLKLPERIFDEKRIRLSQSKTCARIDAPMTPQLYQRVQAIKARRADRTLIDLSQPLIIAETTGEPYKSDYFRHCFAEVRALAVEKFGTELPELAMKTFQDTRDTSVTRLALAGCTMAEIAAITGHSQRTITDIMKHYLVLQPEMADAAIRKLTTWLEREGIAL